jgi:hypothetical protein
MRSPRTFIGSFILMATAACSSSDDGDGDVPSNEGQLQTACSVTSEGATKLAETRGGASHFVASGDTLFAASSRTIFAIPLSGGVAQPIATTPKEIRALEADATRVYALTADSESHDLVAVSKSGGALTTLAHSTTPSTWDVPAVLARQDDRLFWTECGDAARTSNGFVKALDLGTAGATPTDLATATCPWALAVDATHVYWAGSRGGVARVGSSGGRLEIITRDFVAFVAPNSLFIDGDAVYWRDAVTVMRPQVWRRSRTLDSPAERVATDFNATLFGVKDGKLLLGYPTSGSVFTYDPARGGRAENVVCFGDTRALSVDSTRVYWSTSNALYTTTLPSP